MHVNDLEEIHDDNKGLRPNFMNVHRRNYRINMQEQVFKYLTHSETEKEKPVVTVPPRGIVESMAFKIILRAVSIDTNGNFFLSCLSHTILHLPIQK